jgi:hypothetical protein
MVEPWPIEIDGLPFLKMVDLSMAMFNNQMVYSIVLSHVAKISERWEISTYFLSMEPLFFFPTSIGGFLKYGYLQIIHL